MFIMRGIVNILLIMDQHKNTKVGIQNEKLFVSTGMYKIVIIITIRIIIIGMGGTMVNCIKHLA